MKSPVLSAVIKSISLSVILVHFLGCEEVKKESMKNLVEEAKKESIEEVKKEKKKQSNQVCINESTSIKFGGKTATESFSSLNMTLLNSQNPDVVSFLRTTADFYSTIFYKECENTRLNFYTALRFRFTWGSKTNISSADSSINVAGAILNVKGTSTNKHAVWMRETWLQVMLGDLNSPNQNYLQLGLIPFQVGRGISLGAAYDVSGFLGFTPGYSIDQFAPAFLAHFNPVVDRYSIDVYLSPTQNDQISLNSNIAPIHTNELNACSQRGLGRQSFIAAIKNNITVINKPGQKATIEPYIVHQHAPDQDLEFTNDVDTFVTTFGAELDVSYHRLSWGMEGACNIGEVDVKAWDRNAIKIARNSVDGTLISQYTKVYTQDPATTAKPKSALVTNDNITLLAGSPHDRSENGKMIAPNLYNAFDRFRPQQRRLLTGFFAMGDVAYDWIPKVLNVAIGTGYASGYTDQQHDTNKLSFDCLMNENYTGFLPLQSVYSGKRLRHMVVFNQGVPRFNVKNPNADLRTQNITQVLTPDVVNEVTNIIFAGVHARWNIERYKKYDFSLSPNIIAYWIPETADIPVSCDHTTPLNLPPSQALTFTSASSNYLGTEITSEFSITFYDKLKLSGYIGVLLPGSHYRDMAGTLVNGLPTGSDMSYIGNFALNYVF